MIKKDLVEKLKERFIDVHPLIFYRSYERATTAGDLFDILDTLPSEYPIVWNENARRWISTDDIFLLKDFVKEI